MPHNFTSLKDESIRMFDNPIMHKFSQVHYTTPLLLFVPIIAYFLYQAVFVLSFSLFLVPFLYGAGLFAWTIAEYIMHRFVFHWQPPGKLGEKIHFWIHGVHHEYPNDSRRLVMPPLLSLPLAALHYYFFSAILGTYLPPFFAGFLTGYLLYDMLHYAIHHASIQHHVFQELKKHHMMHHFQDPHRGYGVSSKFWDIVFRTTFNLNNSSQTTVGE